MERTYLDMLRAELAEYHTKRRTAAEELSAEQPEYAAKVDAMWQHAIGVKLAQIRHEEQRCLSD